MENPFSNLGKGAIKVASEVLANAKYAFPAASAMRPAPSWASTNSNCRCPSTWKRTQRDTTMLNDVCVPCALICMLDAAVSILVQAMALCCSWGAVVCLCVVDSLYKGMLCCHTWNVMHYTNTP